jgi:hypothetical protein
MFAVDPPGVFPGLSHGRCVTFDILIGLRLLERNFKLRVEHRLPWVDTQMRENWLA